MQLTVHDPAGAPARQARRVRRPRAPDPLGYVQSSGVRLTDLDRAALVFARTHGHEPAARARRRRLFARRRARRVLARARPGRRGAVAATSDRRRAWLRGVRRGRRLLRRSTRRSSSSSAAAPRAPDGLRTAHPDRHAAVVPERPRHDLVRRRPRLRTPGAGLGAVRAPPRRSRSPGPISACTTRATWSPGALLGTAVAEVLS